MDHSLPTHGRYPHSDIALREPFRWPDGSRLAVYFALGLEHYAFGEGQTENLVSGMPFPDVLNTSWREYGNRVGAWRVLDCFQREAVPLAILLNSAVCDYAPALVSACATAGSEMIAHGRSNSDSLAGLPEPAEKAYLLGVSDRILRATGQRPRGWASPWIAETPLTPDLLQETGYEYVLDWCMDDQPVWMRTRGGRILAVPYSQEINDSSAMIGRQMNATDFADMIVDQFDEMLHTPDEQPLVLTVILHSFISGQPYRLRALRRALSHLLAHRDKVWFTQPGAVATHFAGLQRG